MSTAYCYLDPARNRSNLTIQANALTESLMLDGKRCIGVRYKVNGQQREARANREVIVSAGSINSPQLLELSGIGQPEVLKSHGINVRHELKGVGENTPSRTKACLDCQQRQSVPTSARVRDWSHRMPRFPGSPFW